METWRPWYEALTKPSWTPESATIGLIWNVLYPLIAITHGFVIIRAFQKKLSWYVALPFIMNIGANLLFTPILFGLQNLTLAAIDILIVLGTIVWSMVVIWRYHRWVAYLQVPYLIWVSIATIIQLTITFSNI